MGSHEIPWINIKCNALRTLGFFNSYEKDLEEKLNFLDNLKSVNDVFKIWRFRKNTHFQDTSSIQATLRVDDESIQQVSD